MGFVAKHVVPENYNPTQIYARWNFGNGFLYCYGTPINVLSAIEAGMDNPIITVLTQAVSNPEGSVASICCHNTAFKS